MIEQLVSQSHQMDFYKAVFMVESQLSCNAMTHRQVGYDCHPKLELVEFSAVQRLSFPGNAIEKIEPKALIDDLSPVKMHVSFMGLTGCSGVLPQFYTELVLQRLKFKDTAMRDFYDMFNHRLISFYYRAWKKYKLPLHYEPTPSKNDQFSKILSLLSGGSKAHQLYCAGLFSRKVKNATDLSQILSLYLDCDVEIEQLVGQWRKIEPAEQTRLTSIDDYEGQNCQLGIDSIAGKQVWDISGQVNVHILASNEQKAINLLPGGKLFTLAKEILDDYLGHAIQSRILVKTQFCNIPEPELAINNLTLGGNSFLAVRSSKNQSYTELSFKG